MTLSKQNGKLFKSGQGAKGRKGFWKPIVRTDAVSMPSADDPLAAPLVAGSAGAPGLPVDNSALNHATDSSSLSLNDSAFPADGFEQLLDQPLELPLDVREHPLIDPSDKGLLAALEDKDSLQRSFFTSSYSSLLDTHWSNPFLSSSPSLSAASSVDDHRPSSTTADFNNTATAFDALTPRTVSSEGHVLPVHSHSGRNLRQIQQQFEDIRREPLMAAAGFASDVHSQSQAEAQPGDFASPLDVERELLQQRRALQQSFPRLVAEQQEMDLRSQVQFHRHRLQQLQQHFFQSEPDMFRASLSSAPEPVPHHANRDYFARGDFSAFGSLIPPRAEG
jgi:hypothetical protein